MSEFEQLGTWLTPLLNRMTASERTKLSRKISIELRKRNKARINSQVDADGQRFIPRKSKDGENEDQPMFRELSKFRWLRTQATATSASVGFGGGAAKVASVHQQGKLSEIHKGGSKKYPYPRRQLIGFSSEDHRWIESMILEHLGQ